MTDTVAVITRLGSDTTVPESTLPLTTGSSYAVAYYSLSSALGSATTVNVTVNGTGGASAADYSGFQYQIGPDGNWLTATNNGPITLNAGFTTFQLRVLVSQDNIAETG